MKKTLFLFVLVLLFIGGCGYRFADTNGQLVAGVKTVEIVTVENETREPFIENLLTDEIVRELGRRHGVRVVAQDAEAILTSAVTAYENRPISYSGSDDVTEFRVTIHLAAELRSVAQDRVLWKGQLRRHEDYFADDNEILQQDRELATQKVVARLLAEDLYVHLAEGF